MILLGFMGDDEYPRRQVVAGYLTAVVAVLLVAPSFLNAQTPVPTAFTYQGELLQSGTAVTNTGDFESGAVSGSVVQRLPPLLAHL